MLGKTVDVTLYHYRIAGLDFIKTRNAPMISIMPDPLTGPDR